MKNLFLLVFIFGVSAVAAQQDTSKNKPKQILKNLTISGYIDFYYRYDFSSPSNKISDGYVNYTDIKNNITLGLANLAFKYENKKVVGFIEFGIGKKADDFSYEENTFTTRILKQAYFSYLPNDRFKISIGKKYSLEVYESVDAPDNNFYSYTYAFYISPNFNTGIYLNYASKTQHKLELAFTQPFNYLYGSNSNKYFSFQYNSPSFAKNTYATFTILYFNQNSNSFYHLIELVLTKEFNDKLKLILSLDYSNSKIENTKILWNDVSLFFNYQIHPKLSLNWRSELFYVADNGFFPVGNTQVNAHTISAKFKLHKNIYITPEFKIDYASNPVFKVSDTEFSRVATNFFISTYFVF